MTHIMLDLETWGKVPGCDIRSIGACVFDPVGGYTPACNDMHTFYVATDNREIIDPTGFDGFIREYPLSRDPETVHWWSEQTPEAQAAFDNPVDLKEALAQFITWIVSVSVPERQDVRLWANDPHFDVSILDACYRAVGLPVPWHYRAPRSVKTITEAAGMTVADFCNYGEAHNALDDAIAQSMTVCKAYTRLGRRFENTSLFVPLGGEE